MKNPGLLLLLSFAVILSGRLSLAENFALDPGPVLDTVVKTLTPPAGCDQNSSSGQVCNSNAAWNSKEVTAQYVYDVTGASYDVVNLYVHGTLSALKAAITNPKTDSKDAQWKEAVPIKAGLAYDGQLAKGLAADALSSVSKTAQDVVDTMPVSLEKFCGQNQTTSFEKATGLNTRQHFRVYDTGRKDAKGCPILAISASNDIGLKHDPTRPFPHLNHEVEADVDGERDSVRDDLAKSGAVAGTEILHTAPLPPASGDGIQSKDGVVYDISLAGCQVDASP